MATIDKNKIATPQIELTDRALSELKLMLENDLFLREKCFRVSISGKGCQGFSFAIGADKARADDLSVEVSGIHFVLDPFAAFYLPRFTIDFIQDFEKDEEGLVIISPDSEKYHGKFWKEDQNKIPPVI